MNLKKLLLISLVSPLTIKSAIIEPHTLWTHDPTVCLFTNNSHLTGTPLDTVKKVKKSFKFVPRALTQEEIRTIKNTVQREFTKEKTGIVFKGFKSCNETPNADIVLMGMRDHFIFKKYDGAALLGESGLYHSENLVEAPGYYRTEFQSLIALGSLNLGTIVHEFGHSAGLRHEHIHEEAKNDPNCLLSKNRRYIRDGAEPIHQTLVYATSYDSQSIMNYCHLKTTNFTEQSRSILSTKDQEALFSVYQ